MKNKVVLILLVGAFVGNFSNLLACSDYVKCGCKDNSSHTTASDGSSDALSKCPAVCKDNKGWDYGNFSYHDAFGRWWNC